MGERYGLFFEEFPADYPEKSRLYIHFLPRLREYGICKRAGKNQAEIGRAHV